jgi:hypothetical protein
MTLPDIIGLFGAFFVLIVYTSLSLQKLSSDSFIYSLFNLIGGIMILYSLFYAWNFSAVVIEILWIIISMVGILKWYFSRRKQRYLSF